MYNISTRVRDEVESQQDAERDDDAQLKVTGAAVTPKQQQQQQSASVETFLQFPSPTKLRQLGKDGAKELVSSLGVSVDACQEAGVVTRCKCRCVTRSWCRRSV